MDLLILSIYGLSYWLASIPNITFHTEKRRANLLAKEIKKEVESHQNYLNDREKYQIPTHAYDFEPSTLGLEPNDIWDSITIITNLSIENNDFSVFRQSLSAILKLVLSFYPTFRRLTQ